MNHCILCCKTFEDDQYKVKITQKGLDTLINHAELRQDTEKHYILTKKDLQSEKVFLHKNCRKVFTDPRKYLPEQSAYSDVVKHQLRSTQLDFEWKKQCFFCCEYIVKDSRNPTRTAVRSVETLPFRENLLQTCNERHDDWSKEVCIRLNACIDLVAAEALYHKSCHSRFLLNKTRSNENVKASVGRPQNQDKSDVFLELCNWIDAEVELYTLSELHTKMTTLSKGKEVYSLKSMKQKLQEYYQDFIFFAEIKGRKNIVCFRDTANFIINSKWYDDRKKQY